MDSTHPDSLHPVTWPWWTMMVLQLTFRASHSMLKSNLLLIRWNMRVWLYLCSAVITGRQPDASALGFQRGISVLKVQIRNHTWAFHISIIYWKYMRHKIVYLYRSFWDVGLLINSWQLKITALFRAHRITVVANRTCFVLISEIVKEKKENKWQNGNLYWVRRELWAFRMV